MHVFEKAGPDNTDETLRLALAVARRDGLPLVVASTRGRTARAALELLKAGSDPRLLVVSHNTGFGEAGQQELDPAVRAAVEAAGGVVHTGTLALRGAGAAIRKLMGGSEEELINATLRIFCQGAKVCVEMAAMLADAGHVTPGQEIVAVAGTATGADTACVVRPMPSNRLFEIRVREFICKPGVY
jgi:uncharacterized protein